MAFSEEAPRLAGIRLDWLFGLSGNVRFGPERRGFLRPDASLVTGRSRLLRAARGARGTRHHVHTQASERHSEAPLTVTTRAAKVSSDDWHFRAICTRWHTVFKRTAQPQAAYSCPWCDADVR